MVSQITSGKLIDIHKRVNCEGVCDQVVATERDLGRVRAKGSSGVSSLTAFERMVRFVGDLDGEGLVGDRSGGGKFDGWLRVETMMEIARLYVRRKMTANKDTRREGETTALVDCFDPRDSR
jgi:hypothetical protein